MKKKTKILWIILLAVLSCVVIASYFYFAIIFPRINAPEWSEPSDGLSGKLVFKFTDSRTLSGYQPNFYIIHPILLLRNDSDKPIQFFKCVYNGGNFKIKSFWGRDLKRSNVVCRSGGQPFKVITIKPGETIEFDTYDYGYAIPVKKNNYVFNVYSYQRALKPGVYYVDYSIEFDKDKYKKIFTSYRRFPSLKYDKKLLWTGKIELNNVKMDLP